MRKKLLSTFFIIILGLLVFPIISNASDYLYLNNLEFYAQINSDGSMNVTEIWDIDIEDTNTLFKTFKTDNAKYSSITDVKVTDVTNGENNMLTHINTYMYHVTKKCYYGLINDDGNFEIAWGVGLDNGSATRKYKIEYKVNDAIAKYNDYAELYWQFIGQDFSISAKNIKGTIYLPSNVNSKDNIKVWAHSKDLNGTIYATDLNKVEFEMNKYKSGRYVEVRILFPTTQINYTNRIYNSTILESAIAEETKWAEEANRQRELNDKITKAIEIAIFAIMGVGVIFFGKKIFKYKKILKQLNKLEPTQELKYFRDLPDENATPGEAIFLLEKQYSSFNIHFSQIFSATLLNLCLKKYIELEVDNTKKNKEAIKIVNLNKDETGLKEDEKEILQFLLKAIGTKEEISMKDLEKYITNHSSTITKLIEKTHKNVKKSMIKNKYFDEKEHKKYNNYAFKLLLYVVGVPFTVLLSQLILNPTIELKNIILVLPISIIFIINAVYCCKIMNRINVLTQTGLDQQAMWKGLKKYMEDFSLLNEKEVPALVVWEKYLVYATAFGISEKVLKQLKIVYPNIDEMDGINTSTYMYFMYHSNFNTNFSKAINSSIASATYSSGSGSGGGFSGGGGGRRRRPEAEEEDKILFRYNKKLKGNLKMVVFFFD